MKLRDVLPKEFFAEHLHTYARSYRTQDTLTPAAKLLEYEVQHEFSRSNPDFEEWPGKAQNVHIWWELVNGKAVGWNESPSHGWSFPVFNLRKRKKV